MNQRIPIFSKYKTSISLRCIANYAYYDYGRAGNLANYGQPTPPLYNASKVLAPVMTFWGDNDWLADPKVTHSSF